MVVANISELLINEVETFVDLCKLLVVFFEAFVYLSKAPINLSKASVDLLKPFVHRFRQIGNDITQFLYLIG